MKRNLAALFAPRSIALIGASERPESVGRRVYDNLLAGGFSGPIFAVNPNHKTLLGRPAHTSLEAIGEPVDLVVIATPAATIPALMRQCGAVGVRVAVVLSAGFGEGGGHGTDHLEATLHEARRHDVRVVGPNCLGVLLPHHGVNATFSNNAARPGSLALVSGSGALCTSILDWAASRDIGFSAVLSIGAAADVDFGDILDDLALDPHTHSILLYVEGVRHARRFLSGLRAAARIKPVIVMKTGRHADGQRAAASHTAALVGGDDAFDAALRRAGAVRVKTVEQLFAAAAALASEPHVAGDRLAVVTNGGGLGVIAADRAADLGLHLATLGVATRTALDEALPAQWSHANPVDLLGDAPPARYRAAVAACLADPGVDGVLVMLAPQAMTAPREAAAAVIDARSAGGSRKPLLACWMGGTQVEEARQNLAAARVPSFSSPEAAVEAFAYLATYRSNQQLLLQTPGPRTGAVAPDVEGARLIIDAVLGERRRTLSVTESKALLAAFRIPVAQAVSASTANEALVAAESLGFPIAMKIDSGDITHKSDCGGIRLGIANAAEVRGAFAEMVERVRTARPDAHIKGVTVEPMASRGNGRELLVGVVRDPVFGPVITFGAGGTTVEILADRAVALPPLNDYIASDLIARTRTARLLDAFRHLPAVDRAALVEVLLRVSEMVCALPQLEELDINPLLADDRGCVALDARVCVGMPRPTRGHYGHMAIHPYPSGLGWRWQTADGTDVVIRPIRSEDAQIEQAFVRKLSDASRYNRFLLTLHELTPKMLARFTQIDYDREMALIAVVEGVAEGDAHEEQIGVARYVADPDGNVCEFALVVADAWHGRGLGSRLMTHLMEVARDRGLETMTGDVLTSNVPMLNLMQGLGFRTRPNSADASLRIVEREL